MSLLTVSTLESVESESTLSQEEVVEVPDWDDIRRFQQQYMERSELVSFVQWCERLVIVFHSLAKRSHEHADGSRWEELVLNTPIAQNVSFAEHLRNKNRRMDEFLLHLEPDVYPFLISVGNRLTDVENPIHVVLSDECTEVPASWTQLHHQIVYIWQNTLKRIESVGILQEPETLHENPNVRNVMSDVLEILQQEFTE